MNKEVCKECSILKPRIKDKTKTGKQFKFRDETGRSWSGLRCPDCYTEYCRIKSFEKYQEVRVMKIGKHIPVYVAPGTKLHECRDCKNPTVNYYYCQQCTTKREFSSPDRGFEAELSERFSVVL
jgi:hypothetical protein